VAVLPRPPRRVPARVAAGVPVDPRLVRVSTLYFEGGLRDGRELLRLPDPPMTTVRQPLREAEITEHQPMSEPDSPDRPLTIRR
jgi:hypothetical protein